MFFGDVQSSVGQTMDLFKLLVLLWSVVGVQTIDKIVSRSFPMNSFVWDKFWSTLDVLMKMCSLHNVQSVIEDPVHELRLCLMVQSVRPGLTWGTPSKFVNVVKRLFIVVYYNRESENKSLLSLLWINKVKVCLLWINKAKVKDKIYMGCRCYERLQPNTKEFTRLAYTEKVENKKGCKRSPPPPP